MTFVRELGDIGREDVAIAGGKGASLGELVRAGIPVPPGFVVTAEAYAAFREGSVSLAFIDEVLAAFDSLDNDFVAVRSSATAEDGASASWAGELETYLNTTRENLVENIQRCWASLGSERAQMYRQAQGIEESAVSVAVIVQCMVQSAVSGIAFTVHPVTKDPNVMIIEACWGLGELIVGGMVTPDAYTVDKRTRTVIETMIAEQATMMVRGTYGTVVVDVPMEQRAAQKLSATQLEALSSLCMTIERHYGFPCDIEWALAAGEIFILQSRPITTL